MELWNKKYPDFIGYNCRITAFDLMKDKISVKADAKVNASNLFMDQDALKHAPAKKFTRKHLLLQDSDPVPSSASGM